MSSTKKEVAINPSYEHVVKQITDLRDEYRARAVRHRRWFRGAGLLVILLSTTLPLVAGLEFDGKSFAIGVASVVIAATTAVRTFYQWEQLWSLLRQSDFELTYLLDRYAIELAALENQPNDEQPALRYKLVSTLRDDAEAIRRAESTRYFATLQFPTDQHPSASSN